MTLFQSLIIAITQGVTEFLPVSSTGHINLLQYFYGFSPSLSFDIFLNTASLMAVIFYFRSKFSYFVSNLRYIVVGTLPAVIIGLLFKDQIESIFSSVTTLPYEFIFTAAILYITRYFSPKDKPLTYFKAIIIGIFQAFAIIPAVSRSGSTIFAALLLGLSPLQAFNFSFALFIPASIGAFILDLKNLSNLSILSNQNLISFVICFLVSLVSLHYLQKILVNRQIWKFSFYCLALGIILFFLL